MRRVYKFKLKIDGGVQRLDLHGGDPVVLSVAMQDGDLCVWIEAKTNEPHAHAVRRFAVFGTGHEILPGPYGDEWAWCGTVHAPPYVWHVYWQ